MNVIFFLKETDGNVSLDIYRAYYFQVQLQLKLSETNYCDFVVWNSEDLFTQRLYRDEPFILVASEKCKLFIKLCILPELLGKRYSLEPQSISSSKAATKSKKSAGAIVSKRSLGQ